MPHACLLFYVKLKNDLLSSLDPYDIINHYNELSIFSDKARKNNADRLISISIVCIQLVGNMISISITSISITIVRKHFIMSIHKHIALAFMA